MHYTHKDYINPTVLVHQSDNMIHFILPSNIKRLTEWPIGWLSAIISAIFVAIMNMCQPYFSPSWICVDYQQLFLSDLLLSWICVSHIRCHPEYVSAIFVAILNLCQLWLSCWIIILVNHICCYREHVSDIFVAIMIMCQPYLLPSWICVDYQQLFLSDLLLSWICVSHICCNPEFVSAIFVAILNLYQLCMSCHVCIIQV